MNIIESIEQGTQEWHEARRGKVSGTKLKSVMGTKQAQFDLIAELIAEEGTEQSKGFKVTPEMERGIAEEIFAIKRFEEETGMKVKQVGICLCEEEGLDFVAVSPDGLIIDAESISTGKYKKMIEVKSPNSATVIKYKMANMIDIKETGLTLSKRPFLGVPADYKWQVVDCFIVNEHLETLYFVVYDERFIGKEKKLYIVEVKRENELLQDAIFEAKKELKLFRQKWLSWKEVVLPVNF